MPEPFDPLAFLSALQTRWKRIAAVAVGAGAIALVVSLLLPKKYEATTLLMIQPALGGPASSAAMNPAYLDSLRSYEQFVESDGILENLLRDTHLNEEFSGEQFRRSALRVTLVKGTRIVEVAVRLRDPQRAHDVALHLAQITIDRNARVNREEAQRTRSGADQDAEEARKTMMAAQAAIDKFRSGSREDEIAKDVEQQIERKERYHRDLGDAEVELAETTARFPNDAARRGGPQAHCEALRAALASLEKELVKSQTDLAVIQARHAALDNDFQAAEERYSLLSRHATETVASAARHEELEIADPGTVPTQPASPHPLQNTLLAVIVGLMAAVLYETWVWNVERIAVVEERRPTAVRW